MRGSIAIGRLVSANAAAPRPQCRQMATELRRARAEEGRGWRSDIFKSASGVWSTPAQNCQPRSTTHRLVRSKILAVATDSLAHGNDDGVTAEAQHQACPLRLQVHDHARLVLHPEIAGAGRADGKAVAGLAVGAGELGELAQVVHLAPSIDRGEADAADPQPADLERIILAAKGQHAGARAAASDVGRLHLLHIDGRVHWLALDRVRPERDAPCATGKMQRAGTHERNARDYPLHRLSNHSALLCARGTARLR